MSFSSDYTAAGAGQSNQSPQDTQRLVALLGSLLPLLLRLQSQAAEEPFAPIGFVPQNPILDNQAATSLVEDITAASLRTLSAYLDTYAEQFPALGNCVGIVTEAAHRFAVRDYAQAFGLIWQAYRAIEALRAGNPQLPAPRTVALSAAPSSTPSSTSQLH
jgi:hypothetical protein